jgi:putative transcriptional regulator
MIKHHLSETFIMAYAAGTLPEAYGLAAAVHISMCDDCRASAAAYEALGGIMVDEMHEVNVNTDSLQKTLNLITNPNDRALVHVRKVVSPSVLPAPLHDYVGGGLDNVKWRALGMGVRQCILKTKGRQTARLLYIPAGMKVPDHGHGGLELTVVLQGAFADSTGQFGVGDVEIADESLQHTPIADTAINCICLAVTDAPLQFKSILRRMLQPFFNI